MELIFFPQWHGEGTNLLLLDFENPRELHEIPMHYPKVSVWCAVRKAAIIATDAFDGNNGNAGTLLHKCHVERINNILYLTYDENVCLLDVSAFSDG